MFFHALGGGSYFFYVELHTFLLEMYVTSLLFNTRYIDINYHSISRVYLDVPCIFICVRVGV